MLPMWSHLRHREPLEIAHDNRRRVTAAIGLFAVAVALYATPAMASDGKPTITRGAVTERFVDDLFEDLCGITTWTTLTQRFEVKEFPDGRQQIHVHRTYTPDDPRLPVEKGAGTTFIAADGTRTVTGTPIHVIGPDGGTRLLDAGRVTFGNELEVHGPHPSLFVPDLAPYYCPA